MLFLTFSEVWGNELCKRFVSFLCCALTSVFLPSFLGKLVLLSSGLTPSSEWWPIKAASKSRNAWKFTTATSDLDIASSANSCKCSFDFGIIQNGLHFQRIATFFACKQFLNKEKKRFSINLWQQQQQKISIVCIDFMQCIDLVKANHYLQHLILPFEFLANGTMVMCDSFPFKQRRKKCRTMHNVVQFYDICQKKLFIRSRGLFTLSFSNSSVLIKLRLAFCFIVFSNAHRPEFLNRHIITAFVFNMTLFIIGNEIH